MVFQTYHNSVINIWGCLGEVGKIWKFYPREVLCSGAFPNSVWKKLNLSLKVFMDIGFNQKHASSDGISFG